VATRLSDGQIVLFKGYFYWFLKEMPADEGSLSLSDRIQKKWPQMELPVDAAMTDTTGNILFVNTTFAFNRRLSHCLDVTRE
jgi:hypothetical protein